jgi:hypothetical protein
MENLNFQYILCNTNSGTNSGATVDIRDHHVFLPPHIPSMHSGNNVLMPVKNCLKNKKIKKFKRYGRLCGSGLSRLYLSLN